MVTRKKILLMGLGPIGLEIARIAAQRQQAQIVVAVDIDPAKQGHTLGDLLQDPTLDCPILTDLEAAIQEHQPHVAVVATTSYISPFRHQVEPILARGIPIITTCEELAYPWPLHTEDANLIDKLAKQHQAAVLGTGVNPGYLMDFLPTVAAGLCETIDSVTVERIQDASTRRIPFQNKIGVNLSPEEYQKRVAAGTLRHMGLRESAYLIAAKIGFEVSDVSETIEPVLAGETVQGTRQVAQAKHHDQTRVELIFHAAMHVEDPKDQITIHGKPNFALSFDPPVQGDTATAAIVVNAIGGMDQLAPGLNTMADMNGLSFWR